MPPTKKKKIYDKEQTSLFSFVEEKKQKKEKIPEKAKKEEIKKDKEENLKIKSKVIEEQKILEPPLTENSEIPQVSFFKEIDEPFGLKDAKTKLDKVLREGVTSKFIRYLIEKGEIVKNLNRGLLLDVDYDGGQNKAYCKFYDLETDDIKIWIDTTNHEPYCLSKEPISELEKLNLTNYEGFKRFENIKRFNLLRDKEIEITKIYGKTPTNIGGSGTNIRNILAENDKKAWEADIRYHLNYIFDRQLIPGLIYKIKNGNLEKLKFEKVDESSKRMANELRELFKNETPEIQEFSEEFLDIFITPIPEVKRLAIDIEVMVGERDYKIPDPRLAKQEIISVSFVANDGLKLVYMLEREGYTFETLHKKFPSDAKVTLFKSEKNLLTETFRLMWDYPLIFTFNGDNFDLNYLFHRAEKLKIERDLNPIHVKRGFGVLSKAECDLRKGIHIDLFNLFFNRSISGYAFGGAYESASLNDICSALLGEEKFQHDELIHEMEYEILSWYNLKDSILTLELTKFNNSLVWNLIILLCRITKMPIHDMVRRQISTWIQNIFYFEHRRKIAIIPRRSEIREEKPGGILSSKSNDEKFLGAYVVPPVPGIHFDVVVMDFACFSDDTEVLTNDGWLTYEKLKDHKEDHLEVATVNPKDNLFEYKPINEIFEYNYEGEMVNFKQQGIDILVTPNHRMVFNERTNEREITNFKNKICIKRADELKDDYIYAIPYTGEWEGESFDIYIGNEKYNPSDFLSFLGWFITDGGISGRSVNIYQSKDHNFDHIRSSLEKLGLPYKEYNRNRPGKKPEKIFSIHNVSFRDGLKKFFKKNLGKYKRNRIPKEIFKLKREDLLFLFDSMLLGDGRWSGNKCYTFDSLNKDLANDFQILCLKLGFGCNIKKEKLQTKFGNKFYKRINYRCNISYDRKNIIRKHHTNSINYKGKVWCVSVNNATVIVRRKGKPFVSGNSLYPSIIKEYNLSYETVLCPHKDDEDNLVKGTPYHICTHKMGIFAYVVGFFRDIRVKYFKPKSSDKSLTEKQHSYYQTIQQALKVFINGCLPYNEEAIIKNENNEILKIKIGDLENNWEGKEILSIERNSGNFGKIKFVKIKGVIKRKTNEYIEITLSDGRRIQCTENHIIPKIEELKNIKEIEARDLKIGDEILVSHKNSLNSNPPKKLFIPNLIPTNNLWISLERDEYKKYSYRTSERTTNPIVNSIYLKFKYSKVSKRYKCLWNDLDQPEKYLIERDSQNYDLRFLIKYGEEAGKWNDISLDLPIEFFEILGWYIAEGSVDKNRISITQKKKLHPLRYENIISLIKSLNYPLSYDNKKTIRINSNILKEIFITLCSNGAENKKIPLELLDHNRAKVLLKNYFLGDGNLKEGKWKRYSTKSRQLKNDLVYLLGALGKYCSIINPKNSKGVYRIIETEGRKYRRKFHGLVDFNGTTPVRIKNIQLIKRELNVFDIETGNGWFITTNGIIVHNSYGVFGSQNFPLFCLPVAESTTGIGQYSIKQTIKKVETLGIKVLYGDTDSIFLLHPNKEQMKEITNWSKEELDLDLEEEKTYQFLALSERKKNYVGIYKDTQYTDIKGLVAKKKNTPEFIKKIFSEMIEILKQIRNNEDFLKAKDRIIGIVRENLKKIGKSDTFSIEDYAINIGLQKDLKNYTKVIPQHVRAAIELRDATGKEYQKGETISFIKSKGPIGAKAIELAKLQDIDTKKYKELLKSALEQVLDALGITFDEIKGIKKMDAFF